MYEVIVMSVAWFVLMWQLMGEVGFPFAAAVTGFIVFKWVRTL